MILTSGSIAHRAGRRGQLNRERDIFSRNPDVLDEPKRNDVPVQVGIANRLEGLEDGCFRHGCICSIKSEHRYLLRQSVKRTSISHRNEPFSSVKRS